MADDAMRSAIDRMASDKGIDKEEARDILEGMLDELKELMAAHSYVEWTQREGLFQEADVPDWLEPLIRDGAGWRGRRPFDRISDGGWLALADQDLFERFAESEGLLDGLGMEDVLKLSGELADAIRELKEKR